MEGDEERDDLPDFPAGGVKPTSFFLRDIDQGEFFDELSHHVLDSDLFRAAFKLAVVRVEGPLMKVLGAGGKGESWEPKDKGR